MRSTKFLLRLVVVGMLLILTASPATAASSDAAAHVAPVFAGYWDEFVDHWLGMLQKQNGVVVFALCVGAVSLFIITRGKWKK